jgi:hypothetical protein
MRVTRSEKAARFHALHKGPDRKSPTPEPHTQRRIQTAPDFACFRLRVHRK